MGEPRRTPGVVFTGQVLFAAGSPQILGDGYAPRAGMRNLLIFVASDVNVTLIVNRVGKTGAFQIISQAVVGGTPLVVPLVDRPLEGGVLRFSITFAANAVVSIEVTDDGVP